MIEFNDGYPPRDGVYFTRDGSFIWVNKYAGGEWQYGHGGWRDEGEILNPILRQLTLPEAVKRATEGPGSIRPGAASWAYISEPEPGLFD